MEFEEVIRNRHSTRCFSNRVVNKEDLDKILEAARIAPTAKNLQPFKILVIQSEEGINNIDIISPCRYNAPTVLLVLGNLEEAFSRPDYNSSMSDASIVATHMMLEATNIGVDSVWVAMFDAKKVKELFNLDDNYVPIVMLPIGYKADNCPPSKFHDYRKEISDIVEYR